MLVHEIIHRDEGDVDVVGPTEVRHGGLHTSGRDDRGDPRERLTFIIGKFLLKGYKMLHASCNKCVVSSRRVSEGTVQTLWPESTVCLALLELVEC